MPAPARDIFLLGTHFCGSTLLGTALNQHPEVAHAGELGHLPVYFQRLAGHGVPWDPCCLPCALAGRECSLWTPDFRRACEEAGPGGVHRLVRERTGAPLVIDGTKAPAWLKLCLAERDWARASLPPKVVLAARHPYAFMASAKRYQRLEASVAAAHWRDLYWDAFCACSAMGIDFLIVRHEDFMRHRAATVRRLAEFLGIAPVPDMSRVDYAENLCCLGGNPGVGAAGRRPEAALPGLPGVYDAHHARTGHGVLDERWRTELSQGEIEEACYASGLADAAALMGYNLATLAGEYAAGKRA